MKITIVDKKDWNKRLVLSSVKNIKDLPDNKIEVNLGDRVYRIYDLNKYNVYKE